MTTEFSPPFFNLFEQLREAGIPLTVDQYELLPKALEEGFALGGWEDLYRVCCVLWLKPGMDEEVFRETFERYYTRYQEQSLRPTPTEQTDGVLQPLPTEPDPANPSQPTISHPGVSRTTSTHPPVVVTAVRTPTPSPHFSPPFRPRPSFQPKASGSDQSPNQSSNQSSKAVFTFTPQALPWNTLELAQLWRRWRQPILLNPTPELDLEASLRKIGSEGIFSDLVFRPVLNRRAELTVLLDTSNEMIPFRPAIAPLLSAIRQGFVEPARVYTFTRLIRWDRKRGQSDDVLYPWRSFRGSVPVMTFLAGLHPQRSVVWVISDAGATGRVRSEDRIQESIALVRQIAQLSRRVLWLNPLPSDRWRYTSAREIERGGVEMYPFEELSSVNPDGG